MDAFRRKVGPLPVWAWLAIGATLGYVLLRRRSSSSSSSSAQYAAGPTGVSSDQQAGLVPTSGSAADTSGQATNDTLAALGAQNQSLVEGLLASEQNVAQLAAAQMSAFQASGLVAPVDSSTGAGVGSQPGGSGAPSFTFIFPNVRTGATGAGGAAKVKTASKKSPTSSATRYFTYKRQVVLKKGQTVHFASGKGYYAA